MHDEPVAIIDIGSNSVRLVVYAGQHRVPVPIFNEKVLAGLGKGVGKTGEISRDSWDCAITQLRRFKLLLRHFGVNRARVIATAAARDARNGPEFVDAIEALGLECRVISPEEEAWLAGEGVLSAFPGAQGIAGDLGGGSLELVGLDQGAAGTGVSLPLGVLRIAASNMSEKEAGQAIASALEQSGLRDRAHGQDFYMVGGSWRALAKIDMRATGYPLPIVHGYRIAPDRVAELRRIVERPDPNLAKATSSARLASAPAAAMLLSQLVDQLRPASLIVSGQGIREGLLFSELTPAIRAQDPLIEAARAAGDARRRFGEHGDTLDAWIAPLFDDPPALRRIRLAACLLADSAWQANPDFRADRGIELALHGNWVGVTAAERVMMAQALSSNFGRDKLPDQQVTKLCTADQLRRAGQWGLAMRLGQRLSAGVGSILEKTAIALTERTVALRLPEPEQALLADAVSRRLARLATSLDRTPEVVVV